MDVQYSLSQLLEIADRWFKTLFGGFTFRGKAEILKIQQKGKYIYLEMVEYDAEWKVTAKVKGCIFDEHSYTTFLRETKLGNVEAMQWLKILFRGRFSFHKDYNFSIIIDELSSEYTLGELQKKQDDILAELEKLGITYKNKQAQFGYPPFTIAVISAEGAAWLKDFQAVIDHEGYQINYRNYFCAMHGNNAIAAVNEQLQIVQADIMNGQIIDAVAIIRGGGESSGIVRQNDLEIAKSVCLMPVPVIVAIGHTPDRFILQDLAWYGAKTPTDAAYKIIELLEQWEEEIEVLYDAILTLGGNKFLEIRENIDTWNTAISAKLTHFLHAARLQIDGWYNTICAISPKKLLQSGYALLLQHDEYMKKADIDALQTGDELDIQVYDSHFTVKITHKK